MADEKKLMWTQSLHFSTQDHEIWYSDRSSEDEQILIIPLLREKQKYEHGGRFLFKINILFYEDN
jgi:hypothetical protein